MNSHLKPSIADTKRARILEAALELFSTKGYHGTSMQQLAAAAGVSKGLLFHHFTDKAQLLAALIDDLQRRLAPEVPPAGQDPRDAFIQLIDRVVAHLTQAPELAKLLVPLAIHIGDTSEFRALMTQKMQGIQAYLADLLGQMDVANPEIEAQSIALTLDGLQLRTAIDPQYAPVNEIKSALLAKYL